MQVVLLIEKDHYYEIMLDERERMQENLYIVKSKLGWITSRRTTTKECRQDERNMFLLTISSQIPTELHQMDKEKHSTIFNQTLKTYGI